MKKLLASFIIVFFLGLIAIISGFLWWTVNSKAPSIEKTEVIFTVTKGASAEKVGQMLFEKGLIKSPLAFKIYVQFLDKSGRINAGRFKLDTTLSLAQVVEALQGGPLELWVTIPEGKRREEVADIVSTALGKEGTEASNFKESFLEATVDKEGYLFPDTYLFAPEVSAETVVQRFTSTFETKYKNIETVTPALSKTQIVVLASILERETKGNEEKPIVAGILLKRLETAGWLIQADATVQYAVASIRCPLTANRCDNWWPILTREDLEIDSPYNSYKYKALPPTPIANPGLESLKAAANPTDSGYFFYIHEDNGTIHYATTLQEHNANVAKYLGK